MNVGESIKNIRQNRKLSRKELSDISNVSPGYIEEIESGKKTPTIDILYKLSTALSVTISELVGEKEPSLTPELKELLENVKSLPPGTVNLLNAFLTALSQGQTPRYGKQDIDGETVQYLYDASTHPEGMTEEEVRKGLEIQKKLDELRKNKEEKK